MGDECCCALFTLPSYPVPVQEWDAAKLFLSAVALRLTEQAGRVLRCLSAEPVGSASPITTTATLLGLQL